MAGTYSVLTWIWCGEERDTPWRDLLSSYLDLVWKREGYPLAETYSVLTWIWCEEERDTLLQRPTQFLPGSGVEKTGIPFGRDLLSSYLDLVWRREGYPLAGTYSVHWLRIVVGFPLWWYLWFDWFLAQSFCLHLPC